MVLLKNEPEGMVSTDFEEQNDSFFNKGVQQLDRIVGLSLTLMPDKRYF